MTDTDELVKRIAEVIDGKAGKGFTLAEVVEGFRVLQARIKELEKALFISNESGKQLGRLVREKDDDRIFFRDKCKELEAQLAARGEPVGYLWVMNDGSKHVMWSPISDDDAMYSAPVTGYKQFHKLFTHPAPAVPAGSITISKELRDFLMGAESFDGHWFGDSVDGRRFWWRKYLEAAAPKGE